MHEWGQGVCGKSVPSAQLCCEPKTLKKKKKFLVEKSKSASKNHNQILLHIQWLTCQKWNDQDQNRLKIPRVGQDI